MENDEGRRLNIVSYPYKCISGTGRGIDEYCRFIIDRMDEEAKYNLSLLPYTKKNLGFLNLISSEFGLFFKMARTKSGVFHCLSPVGAKTAAILKKRPLVVTVHDVIPFHIKRFHLIRYFFLRKFIGYSVKKADKVIVPFEFTKSFLLEKYKIDSSKIVVVNYWVENKNGTEPFERTVNKESKSPYVIFFGSHNPIIRGADIALKAFYRISKGNSDLTLKIVVRSDSPDVGELKAMINEMRLEHRVQLLNLLEEDEMDRSIGSALAVIYPARIGYSYLFTKTLQLNAPVIGTASLDMMDFEDRYEGLCGQDDPDCLAVKIRKLINDEKFRLVLLEQGKKILEDFSPEDAIEKILSIYDEFIK